jgi:hypothetical protein
LAAFIVLVVTDTVIDSTKKIFVNKYFKPFTGAIAGVLRAWVFACCDFL